MLEKVNLNQYSTVDVVSHKRVNLVFDSITAGTAERCSVSDVLINSVHFLGITRTIAFLSASHATNC